MTDGPHTAALITDLIEWLEGDAAAITPKRADDWARRLRPFAAEYVIQANAEQQAQMAGYRAGELAAIQRIMNACRIERDGVLGAAHQSAKGDVA